MPDLLLSRSKPLVEDFKAILVQPTAISNVSFGRNSLKYYPSICYLRRHRSRQLRQYFRVLA